MTYTRAGFDRLFGNHLIIEISSNGTLRVEADRIDPKWFTEGPCLNANFSSSQGWHCYAGIKDADIFYGYLRLEPDGKLNVHAFSVEGTDIKCHSSYQGMPNYCFGATGIKIEGKLIRSNDFTSELTFLDKSFPSSFSIMMLRTVLSADHPSLDIPKN